MNWDALGALAELFGALAVVGSLVYVGYQIRETRIAVRASTAQARTELGVSLITSRYQSDIAELLVRSEQTPDALTAVDHLKLASFFAAHVRHSQNLFYQREQGLLEDFFADGAAHVVTFWIRKYSWAREEWARTAETVPDPFRRFIDAELDRHPGPYRA